MNGSVPVAFNDSFHNWTRFAVMTDSFYTSYPLSKPLPYSVYLTTGPLNPSTAGNVLTA